MRPNALKPVFLAALLTAPVLIIFLALLGLGAYCLMGDQKTALWMCGIAFGASVLLAPIAFWVFSEPPMASYRSATVKITLEPLKDMQL